MNLQPSISILYNERRQLFADELFFGGHGQIPMSGAGTYTPTSTAYCFYKIDFLSSSVVGNVAFRTTHSDSQHSGIIYQATNASYNNFSFPAGYSWMAPITSITLSSGSGIAYQYKKFIPEDSLYI